jgi:three-Cys-motif partner protein
MPDEPIWPIEEHTKAKHELLRRYLGAWFPILASRGYNRRVVFLDGFAGPGIYKAGEPGSPIIALQTLVEHPHFQRWTATEFRFLFIESEQDRFRSLEAEISRLWGSRAGGRPQNINVSVTHGEFAEVAQEIIDALSEQKKALAPTLAFIDPFGWSGVPMTLIRDLLSFDRCEVLFNFMFDSVNRFVADGRPEIARHFAELFGTYGGEHAKAANLSGEQRKEFLAALYAQQLQDVAGFTHVRKFELIDTDRGRTAYFLMFGTRHRTGLRVMKDAMWALDPVGGAMFAGSTGNQEVLFQPEPDFGPLRNAILERFRSETVDVDQIEAFVIDETDYKASHYKKQVLRELEEDGLLTCVSDRKRRFTYPSGTLLRF